MNSCKKLSFQLCHFKHANELHVSGFFPLGSKFYQFYGILKTWQPSTVTMTNNLNFEIDKALNTSIMTKCTTEMSKVTREKEGLLKLSYLYDYTISSLCLLRHWLIILIWPVSSYCSEIVTHKQNVCKVLKGKNRNFPFFLFLMTADTEQHFRLSFLDLVTDLTTCDKRKYPSLSHSCNYLKKLGSVSFIGHFLFLEITGLMFNRFWLKSSGQQSYYCQFCCLFTC